MFESVFTTRKFLLHIMWKNTLNNVGKNYSDHNTYIK